MFDRSGRSSKRAFIFMCFWCGFAGLFNIANVYFFVMDVRATETTAQVTSIDRPRGKYILNFTTADGTMCADSAVAAPDGLDDVRVGDQIQVRYMDRVPCSNVRAADDSTWWAHFLIAPVMLAVGLTVAIVMWRHRSWRS